MTSVAIIQKPIQLTGFYMRKLPVTKGLNKRKDCLWISRPIAIPIHVKEDLH